MDVKSFQEKLARMVSVAKEQENQISLTQIREFMGENQLDEGQLEKVLVYFKSLNISCEGEQPSQKEEEEEADIVKADPLSAEEEQYLREYEKSLEGVASAGQEEFRKLCQAMERRRAGGRENSGTVPAKGDPDRHRTAQKRLFSGRYDTGRKYGAYGRFAGMASRGRPGALAGKAGTSGTS